MLATVIKPYTDRERGEVHLAGESVELTQARAAELSGAGYVSPVEQPAPVQRAVQAKGRRKKVDA